jgi:hypothetical protein
MGMQINDKIIGAAIIALVVLSGFAAYTFGHSSGYTGGYTTGNEEGYTKGDVAGYQKGFSDGNKTGYLSGYQSGYQSGQQAGYQSGYQSGQQAGYQSGYQSGQQVGYQSGRNSVEVDIFGNANRLNSAYNDAISLVSEIQQRCDAMGVLVTKSCYLEWMNRNSNAITAGERLASYTRENLNVLNSGNPANWGSDLLARISLNKERIDRDNQVLFHLVYG